MAVSIQDVAREAGVSIGTVSRAFNDYPDIRPETRERVLAAAQSLGYAPNLSARSLSAKRTNNIAFIAAGFLKTDWRDSLGVGYLRGALRYTTEHHLELFLCTVSSEEQQRTSYADFCAQHPVNGAIICGIATDDPYFRELVNAGIPTVGIDLIKPSEAGCFARVSIDNRLAAAEATEHLLAAGCKRLTVMTGRMNALVCEERSAGVADALAAYGREAPQVVRLEGDFSEDGAYRLMQAHLREGFRPDGVFCFSDLMAVGVLRALRDAGLRVPQDVKVVGFDDQAWCDLLTPPLTTVGQDGEAFGYEAARLLHGMMNNQAAESIVLPHKLIVRESTAG